MVTNTVFFLLSLVAKGAVIDPLAFAFGRKRSGNFRGKAGLSALASAAALRLLLGLFCLI